MFNKNHPIDSLFSEEEMREAREHARDIFQIMMDNRAKTELDRLKRYDDVLVENMIKDTRDERWRTNKIVLTGLEQEKKS